MAQPIPGDRSELDTGPAAPPAAAIARYNRLARRGAAVGGLFHPTC